MFIAKLRAIASSSVTASPHIPVHLLGCRHPLGAAAGVVAGLRVENCTGVGAGMGRADLREGAMTGAELMHVKGFEGFPAAGRD